LIRLNELRSGKRKLETSNTKPISTIVEIESNGVTLKQTMKTYTRKIRSNLHHSKKTQANSATKRNNSCGGSKTTTILAEVTTGKN
jgi:hypothetical protein